MSLFLVDFLSRFQFLPTLTIHEQIWDKLRDPYFQKVGRYVPQITRGSASDVCSMCMKEPYKSFKSLCNDTIR